jgi:hypothetical protein
MKINVYKEIKRAKREQKQVLTNLNRITNQRLNLLMEENDNINKEHDLFFSLISINNLQFYTKQLVNIYIPKKDNLYTKIDLILISQKGIYVIEYKDMNGDIIGKHKSKYWNMINKNKKIKFLNPINENFSHISTLKKLFSIDNYKDTLFKSYIIFNENNLDKITYNTSQSLKIFNKNKLSDILNEDNKNSKNLLSIEQVNFIFENLQKYTIIDQDKKYIDEFFHNNK